jgi:hypothetical protein
MDKDAVGLTHDVWVALPGLLSLRRQIQIHIGESKSRLGGRTSESRLDRVLPGLDLGGKSGEYLAVFENCETEDMITILIWANVGA